MVDEDEQTEEQPIVEEGSIRKSGLAKNLMQFPIDLVDLMLSAPAAGAIAKHAKNCSKKKRPEGRKFAGLRLDWGALGVSRFAGGFPAKKRVCRYAKEGNGPVSTDGLTFHISIKSIMEERGVMNYIEKKIGTVTIAEGQMAIKIYECVARYKNLALT